MNSQKYVRFISSSIKTLNKNELELELKNRGLDGQGKKEDLVNRLTKAIIEIPRMQLSTTAQQKVLTYQ